MNHHIEVDFYIDEVEFRFGSRTRRFHTDGVYKLYSANEALMEKHRIAHNLGGFMVPFLQLLTRDITLRRRGLEPWG